MMSCVFLQFRPTASASSTFCIFDPHDRSGDLTGLSSLHGSQRRSDQEAHPAFQSRLW
jgi:hypothetical protein